MSRHFNIVSSLYKLLGEHTSREFAAASEVEGLSKNLRNAIASLKQEAELAHRYIVTSEEIEQPPVQSRKQQRQSPAPRSRPNQKDQLEPREAVIDFLSDSRRFVSKESVASYASEIGLKVQVDPKWGRPRTVSKISRAIIEDPKAMARIKADLGRDPQSSGWLGVILGNK